MCILLLDDFSMNLNDIFAEVESECARERERERESRNVQPAGLIHTPAPGPLAHITTQTLAHKLQSHHTTPPVPIYLPTLLGCKSEGEWPPEFLFYKFYVSRFFFLLALSYEGRAPL